MARPSRFFPLGPVVLACLSCAAFAPPVSASLSNDDAGDALSSGVGETAHAAQSARDAMLVFAHHAETQEQSGRTERVYGAKVGLLFSDGSWRVIAEGRTPAYAPDGRVIAISHKQLRPRGAYSTPNGIMIHRLDGSPVRRLTWGLDRDPTWSPSGHRLAFTRTTCADGNRNCRTRIFTIGRDGGDKRFLAEGHSPAWSSRGQIAYIRERKERSQLWLTTSRGTPSRRLPLRSNAFEPDWSPSGNRVAFVREERFSYAAGLAVVDVDGTGLRWIRRYEDGWLAMPAWAPNGRIGFMNSSTDLYTMPSAGGASRLLFQEPPVETWCLGCGPQGNSDYLVTWFDGFDWRPSRPTP